MLERSESISGGGSPLSAAPPPDEFASLIRRPPRKWEVKIHFTTIVPTILGWIVQTYL